MNIYVNGELALSTGIYSKLKQRVEELKVAYPHARIETDERQTNIALHNEGFN